MLLPLLSLIKKEFRQIFRDKFMPRIIFVMPIFMLFLLGYAVNMDIKHIPTLLVDQDNSQSSREVLNRFRGSPNYFDVKGSTFTLDKVKSLMDSGSVALAVVLPKDFEKNLHRQVPSEVQLIIDAQNGNTAQIAMGYASRILQDYSTERMQGNPAMGKVHLIQVEGRNAFNPNLESNYFYIPGIITILVMVNTMALASLSIVGEREKGTLDQLMVTPLTNVEFIAGKLIPFVLIALLSSSLALAVAKLWFKIPICGNLWTLLLFTGVYLLSTLGLSILISALSQTQQQAMFLAWFFMITLMMMSGFFAPLENTPPVIEMISRFNPLRYYVLAIREILIKGTPFSLLLKEFWILLGSGILILSGGILFQRKRSV